VYGKLRETFEIQDSLLRQDFGGHVGSKNQEEVEKLAIERGNVKRHLEGKEIKKVIYVPGKILNFVV